MKCRAALLLSSAALVVLVVACATSPTGRRTLKLFPEDQMAQMGVAAYNDTKTNTKISGDKRATSYVACVSRQLTGIAGGDWEVTLFEDDSANAFALPGGKIGVHTGLLKVAETPGQLAAVIGHEIAHVQAGHANERVSSGYVAQAGMQVVEAVSGAYGIAAKSQLMGLLGAGVQIGVLLPFSRSHESEADILGQRLMAQAGYNPNDAIALWENMARASEGAPPEMLSTHPSHSTRMDDLRAGLRTTMPMYEEAKRAGRKPTCQK